MFILYLKVKLSHWKPKTKIQNPTLLVGGGGIVELVVVARRVRRLARLLCKIDLGKRARHWRTKGQKDAKKRTENHSGACTRPESESACRFRSRFSLCECAAATTLVKGAAQFKPRAPSLCYQRPGDYCYILLVPWKWMGYGYVTGEDMSA
jgi:hypothetical protein